MNKYDLSVLIPARNEEFLSRTVQDILEHKKGNTEIIVGLDGKWADPGIPDHKDVTLVYYPESIGQRALTNQLCKLSNAKYVMKCDAHVSFDEGFDVKLMTDMQGHDNWTMAPIMRNLWVFDWVCSYGHKRYQGISGPCKEKIGGTDKEPVICGKETKKNVVWIAKQSPQSKSYSFDPSPHFQYFGEYCKRPEYIKDLKETGLTESLSLQGSCFLLTREKYWELGICDENIGSWGSQGVEVSMKTRTTGGKVMINHHTFYAHLFRTAGGDFSFPYHQSQSKVDEAKKHVKNLFFDNKWEKQIYPLSKVIEQFWPVNHWTEDDLKKLKEEEVKTKRSGIYSIKNKINGKIYVGSTIKLSQRFSEHLRALKGGYHENSHLQNSWNQHVENDFSFDIEYFCAEDKLVEQEQKFIDKYKEKIGWDNMYNIEPIADSSRGHKHSVESLEKMSRQQSGEGNGFFGKKHTPESIAKMSEARKGSIPWNTGRQWSEDVKEKISSSNLGKEAWNKGLTMETDERVKPNPNKGVNIWEGKEPPRGMLGKTHSEESKRKIGDCKEGAHYLKGWHLYILP